MKVTAEIVEVKGECLAGHKTGDKILIEQNAVSGTACIDIMMTILTYGVAMYYGGEMPWLTDPEVLEFSCSDHSKVRVRMFREVS